MDGSAAGLAGSASLSSQRNGRNVGSANPVECWHIAFKADRSADAIGTEARERNLIGRKACASFNGARRRRSQLRPAALGAVDVAFALVIFPVQAFFEKLCGNERVRGRPWSRPSWPVDHRRRRPAARRPATRPTRERAASGRPTCWSPRAVAPRERAASDRPMYSATARASSGRGA